MSESIAKGVPVRTLTNVRVGDTATAKTIEAIARDAHGGDLQVALPSIAEACAVDDWTVYRWLRGTASPRRAALRLLSMHAESVGVAA